MSVCKNIAVYSKKNISYEPIYKYGKLVGNKYIYEINGDGTFSKTKHKILQHYEKVDIPEISKPFLKELYKKEYKNIVSFIIDKKKHITTESIIGKVSNKNRYIYKALGYNQFEKKVSEVPKEYKKVPIDNYYKREIENYYCKNKNPEPKFDGIEVKKWLQRTSNKSLTIKDIRKLKKGDIIKMVVFDRNLYDTLDYSTKPNTLYTPQYFFRKSIVKYTHNKDLTGKLQFVHNTSIDDFEFDIEFKPNNWYPLTNGILPKKDSQGFIKLLGKDKKWQDFSENTRIGWRGHMIQLDIVKKLPKVYRYEP